MATAEARSDNYLQGSGTRLKALDKKPALGYYILQGYADGFEEIKDEDIIPDYDPLFTRDAQNKNILLSFKKIK